MNRLDARQRAAATVLLLTVLALVLLAIVSATNGTAVDVGDGLMFRSGGQAQQQQDNAEAEDEDPNLPTLVEAILGIGLLMLITLAAALSLLGLAAILLMLSMIRIRRRRKRREGGPQLSEETADDDRLPPAGTVLRRAASDALDQLERYAGGSKDDAVIAAWVAVEQAAERVGLARQPHQTPTEFTTTVLSGRQVDRDALHRLRGLYQRARFGSGSALTDRDVAAAVNALRRVVADLSAGEPASPAPTAPAGGRP